MNLSNPLNKVKEIIHKNFESERNETYPFYPPIKYPDLKVNPFRVPTFPESPSMNATLSEYIDAAKSLCRKLKW